MDHLGVEIDSSEQVAAATERLAGERARPGTRRADAI
jgi:hypothetical protein